MNIYQMKAGQSAAAMQDKNAHYLTNFYYAPYTIYY